MIRHIMMTADIRGSEWSYSLELARALAGHGVRVSLAGSGGSLAKEQRREAARVPGLVVYESDFSVDRHSRTLENSKSREWLLEIENKLRPDMVHLNSFSYGPIVFQSPSVLTTHTSSEALLNNPSGFRFAELRSEVISVLDCVNLVISPTIALLEHLKSVYNFTGLCKVIPYFRRNNSGRETHKQKFVYSTVRQSDSTAVRNVIEAAASEYNWPVVTGSHSSISSKSIEQMSKAAIYCSPNDRGPAEVSVLEGALSRCALVIGDSANLRENWNNCAVFVPNNDSEYLKRSLQLLINDQALREDLAQRAYSRAQEFSPERCIDDYLDAYQIAVSSKHKQHAVRRRPLSPLDSR